MKLPRRSVLHLAAALPAACSYRLSHGRKPIRSRPVRLIVGFPAGGTTDLGRAPDRQWLSERLGQPFVIENRPGAGAATSPPKRSCGRAGRLHAARVTASNAINATLYDKLNFDFLRDIAPVAGVIRMPLVMVVNPSVPAKTVPEFIAYAKANPGKINMASRAATAPRSTSPASCSR